MKNIAFPNCEECGVIEDLQHLLMGCVQYESSRNLVRSLNLNTTDVGLFHTILSAPNGEDEKGL